jgi:hypothetical protein
VRAAAELDLRLISNRLRPCPLYLAQVRARSDVKGAAATPAAAAPFRIFAPTGCEQRFNACAPFPPPRPTAQAGPSSHFPPKYKGFAGVTGCHRDDTSIEPGWP